MLVDWSENAWVTLESCHPEFSFLGAPMDLDVLTGLPLSSVLPFINHTDSQREISDALLALH